MLDRSQVDSTPKVKIENYLVVLSSHENSYQKSLDKLMLRFEFQRNSGIPCVFSHQPRDEW